MAEAKKRATKKAAPRKQTNPLAELEKAVQAARAAGYDVSCRVDRINENNESEGRFL